MIRRSAAAGLLLLALAGCGTTAGLAPQAAPLTVTVAIPADVVPTSLTFPAVGVAAPLVPTGLDKTGAIAVPPLDQAGEVDWLHWSRTLAPGRPLVLASHVNGRRADGSVLPGGFQHLAAAKIGDLATVTYSDGHTATFRVDRVSLVSKAAFPANVYDPSPVPTILAITCGGTIQPGSHSFDDNVLVHGVPA